MIARLRHRGPDDAHVVAGDGYTLGVARLSIQDVAHGRQPLTDESGRIVAAQNGEIYNYPALRDRLEKNGHRLSHPRCDTEITCPISMRKSATPCQQLDGMFAFAVWDGRTQTGMLARDRTGKKPLYLYSASDGALWFASEIKSLLEIPGLQRSSTRSRCIIFSATSMSPTRSRFFRASLRCRPATRLVWQAGRPAVIEPYWRLSWAPLPEARRPRTRKAWPRACSTCCAKGVKKRLLSGCARRVFSQRRHRFEPHHRARRPGVTTARQDLHADLCRHCRHSRQAGRRGLGPPDRPAFWNRAP